MGYDKQGLEGTCRFTRQNFQQGRFVVDFMEEFFVDAPACFGGRNLGYGDLEES